MRSVLIVDDDTNILSAFVRGLRKHVDLTTASSATEGLELLEKAGGFAVVISDQQMPGMDGITFLKSVRKKTPDAVRIMLTGNTDHDIAANAVNQGAIFRFLTKPCPADTLSSAIDDALKHHALIAAERELLEKTLAGSVKVLVDVLTASFPESFRQVGRLREWAKLLHGRIENLNGWELDMAILLSGLGTALLPAQIRVKMDTNKSLDETEEQIVEQTPELARDLITNIPRLDCVGNAIYYKGKGFDGSGFPYDGVMGIRIPLSARLLKILIDLNRNCTDNRFSPIAFSMLERSSHVYDPQIYAIVKSVLLEQLNDETVMVVEVPVRTLQSGDETLGDIRSTDDKLLLAAGLTLNDAMIKKIKMLHKMGGVCEPIPVRRLVRDEVA